MELLVCWELILLASVLIWKIEYRKITFKKRY